MSIITLIVVLVVVGVLLWLANRYIPMDAPYKVLLNVVILLAMITFVLSAVGVLTTLPVEVAVVIVWIGVLMWVVDTYIPMAVPFKRILQIVVVIALVWWLLQITGLLSHLDGLTNQRIGK